MSSDEIKAAVKSHLEGVVFDPRNLEMVERLIERSGVKPDAENVTSAVNFLRDRNMFV